MVDFRADSTRTCLLRLVPDKGSQAIPLTGATLWKGHPLAILVADADVSARSKTCSDANALTKRSEETEVRLKEDSGVRVMRIHQAAGGQTTAASADGSPSGG